MVAAAKDLQRGDWAKALCFFQRGDGKSRGLHRGLCVFSVAGGGGGA